MDYVLLLCLVGYPLAQYGAIRHASGGWRMAFALPAVPMALVVAYTALAFSQGANLWPILLIFTAPLAILYLLLLAIARRITRWLQIT